MCQHLRRSHLAPVPLTLRLQFSQPRLYLIRHRRIEQVLHTHMPPWNENNWEGPQPPLSPRVITPRMITKIYRSIGKTALVQEIKLYAYVAREDPLAVVKHNRHDEQTNLVDEPRPDRLRSERGTSHRNIVRRLSLQIANPLRVEFPLETRLRCRDGFQRFGIDDFIGRLPDPREVQHGGRPIGNDVWRLPNGHSLVHLASIEIGAYGAHEIVDES